MRIAARELRHRFRPDSSWVLNEVSMTLETGDVVAVMGPSGSGKSTLLSSLGLRLKPTRGTILVDGVDPWSSGRRRADLTRRRDIAWIMQTANILPHRSVEDNVALPLLGRGYRRDAARTRARTCLEVVGLEDRASERAKNLSGGQAQRVAVARALAVPGQLLLADEPTAQLDSVSRDIVLASLVACARQGTCLVVATHDPEVAAACAKTYTLRDGTLS